MSDSVPDSQEERRQEPAAAPRCIACRSALPDKSFNPHAELCPACRERYIRYPFPKWLFIVLGAILVVNALCYIWFPGTMELYARLKKADSLYDQKHFLLAARAYEALAGETGKTDDIMLQLVNANMRSGYFADAIKHIDGYFAGRSISDAAYETLNGYTEVLDAYDSAYRILEETYAEGMDAQAYIDALHGKQGNRETDPVLLLQMALGTVQLGNNDEALRLINQAIAGGDRYLAAYSAKASIQRRMGHLDQAEVSCQSALEANRDDVEALRQYAVIHILRGQYREAVEKARAAYELEPSALYVREAYANACHLVGDRGTRDAVLAEMKGAGDPEASVVEQLIGGHTTVEGIYME